MWLDLDKTETISGAKTFASAPNVPTPTSSGQVANKDYVDSSVANVGGGSFLSTAGGTMTGPILLPGNPSAPLQAATKQYVDSGIASKADLIAGNVPASEVGTGSATVGACLVGNGTTAAAWGVCGGSSGTGNVSTAPAASQNVIQPAGTQFSTNDLANTRYVTPSWNWGQSPADNLGTAGSNTIHLSPCPLGIDTSNNANAQYSVYIAATGTAEAVPVTGGTCTPGGSSGTITVTTTFTHAAGYTVGSASTGIQEAINDAGAQHAGIVLLPASGTTPNYMIYATVFLNSKKTLLSGYGAMVQCFTRTACLINGNYLGTSGLYNSISGIEFVPGLNVDGVQISSVTASSGTFTITTAANHPFVTGDYVILFYSNASATQEGRFKVTVTAANQFTYSVGSSTFSAAPSYGWAAIENTAIEDIADHLTLRDIKMTSIGTQFFHWGVVVGNDQSFKLDGMTNEGNGVIRCTANFCGAMVYGRGDQGAAPVINIDHLEASMQCSGNGVRYVSGNTLHVMNSVVQGFAQYGIYYAGGLQNLMVGGTYEESGGCPNLAYPGSIGASAGIVTNNDLTYVGDDPIGGQFPAFVAQNTGTQVNNYFVAVHSSAQGNMGMYYIGSCLTSGTGNCTTYWPEFDLDGLGTVTYDELRTVGASAIPPNGTGSYAIATGITSSVCSTLGICNNVDAQTGTSTYTVGTAAAAPKMNFWPGAVVLGKGAHLNINDCGQAAGIITTTYLPSVYCNHSTPGNAGAYTPFWAEWKDGDSVGNNNASVGAVLKQAGPASGAASSGLTGLYGFLNTATLGQTDMVTLAYSNPFLALATPGYRPTASATDTAIGFDSAGSTLATAAQMAFRAPVAISQYVGSVFDNSSYKERLTAAAKTFNVPVTVNGNLTVTGSCTGCSGGSGTVNTGTATQMALYSGTGTAVSGDSGLTDNGTTLTYTGSGGISATTGTFSGNLTLNGQLMVAGPWMVSSPIPGTAMGAAGSGTSALGISNDGNFYISANAGTPLKIATTATSSFFSNLAQEDANDIGEFNGTSPQSLHVYSSYTSSSVWQRTSLGFDATDGYSVVKSENSTSGAAPGLGFWINSGLKWVIDPTSNFKPWTDQTSNIGSFSGSSGIGLRPATIYVAGNSSSNSGFELGKFANNSYELCNDTTNGTVANGLAVLTSSGCAVKPGSAATTGVIGVVIANAGTSGTVTLVRTGYTLCTFDSTATVVGDYVVASSTVSSGFFPLCHDAGSSLPGGAQVLGRVLQATTGGVLAQMFFDMPGSSAGPSAVSSVFGRTGAVTATSGDYSVGQVTGAAPAASPTFTGTATLPDGTTNTSSGFSFGHALTLPSGSVAATQSAGDNSTKVATTAYVKSEAQFAWSCPIGGTGAVAQYCNWTLPAALTITGFDLAASTAPGGCTTSPVVQVWDGTASAEVGSYSVTMGNGTNFYTLVTGSTNVASGHLLRLKVTTAAVGCGTNPGNIVATVSYQMQN